MKVEEIDGLHITAQKKPAGWQRLISHPKIDIELRASQAGLETWFRCNLPGLGPWVRGSA